MTEQVGQKQRRDTGLREKGDDDRASGTKTKEGYRVDGERP